MTSLAFSGHKCHGRERRLPLEEGLGTRKSTRSSPCNTCVPPLTNVPRAAKPLFCTLALASFIVLRLEVVKQRYSGVVRLVLVKHKDGDCLCQANDEENSKTWREPHKRVYLAQSHACMRQLSHWKVEPGCEVRRLSRAVNPRVFQTRTASPDSPPTVPGQLLNSSPRTLPQVTVTVCGSTSRLLTEVLARAAVLEAVFTWTFSR